MLDADVLVVGGGPAGSSIAHALAARGVDVLVVDRARFPRPKPCAEYLSPQASRILSRMGALDQVEGSGAAALSGIRIYAPNGSVIAGDFVAKHGYHGYRDRGLSIRREILDAILVERARGAGARVVEGAKVTDLLREPTGRVRGVRMTADDASRDVRARVVVGADGLGSVVARRLALTRRLRWPRRIALVTHYKGVKDVGEHGEMHVAPDGYVGIADVGGGLTTVAAVFPVSRSREISRDRVEFLRRWLFDQRRLALRFASAERVTPVVATGPFASYARQAWAPGAALVGDAADFFDPFTGEGIYSALRGGEMLADHVSEMLAARKPALADAALREYDRARRREFGGKWIVERVIGAVVASPRLINRAARRLAARKDLADLLIGVTGNFVPAREVIRLGYVWSVFISSVP
ncbi:MAG TPA: NAD(P)/FAD-dependent oxidoreductase [Gemmatimonadaceae bacterium]|jgi:flavin-dependent dehydrogenase|nr:NAD(P)/FAD-dependent oxidoreductase [Gemmatimonadaceae bacterium]